MDTQRFANYKEFLWYLVHEKELLEKYDGRFLIIKDGQVMGDFESRHEARKVAYQLYEPGSFIIHHCQPYEKQKLPKITNQRLFTIHE